MGVARTRPPPKISNWFIISHFRGSYFNSPQFAYESKYGEAFIPTTETAWLVLIALALFAHILGQGLIAYTLPYLSRYIFFNGLIDTTYGGRYGRLIFFL